MKRLLFAVAAILLFACTLWAAPVEGPATAAPASRHSRLMRVSQRNRRHGHHRKHRRTRRVAHHHS